MGEKRGRYSKVLWATLWYGGIGGLAGLLVDLDHWLAFKGIECASPLAGRPLHVPLAIVAGCLGIYCCTRLRGLAARLVLKNEKK